MEYMFMPLRRYADFSGRSRRMEYWMYALFVIGLWFVFLALALAIIGTSFLSAARGSGGGFLAAGGSFVVLILIAAIVWLALLVPSLAVGVRRLHDTERSGWWLGGYIILSVVSNTMRTSAGNGGLSTILGLATLLYAIVLLVFFCLDGTRGPNKYGPDPKGQVDAQVFA